MLSSVARSAAASMARGGRNAVGMRRLAAAASSGSADRLMLLQDAFRSDVDKVLPKDGKGVIFTSAFLVSDNIIIDLLAKYYPEILHGEFKFVGVDTLHMFDETLDCANEMEAKYGKKIDWFKPRGLETRADFEETHGHCEELAHADFDQHSKVEPFSRALNELNKDVLITGRRQDQGAVRLDMDVWEENKRIFNPVAAWTWEDVLAYVDREAVPYNKKHELVFRHNEWICPRTRHRSDLPWNVVNLGKPYWQASEEELRGEEDAENAWVFKSFGDVHTSVPVYPHESERAGRFVRYANSECGIHTRAAVPGAPHGGELVDLMAKSDEEAKLMLEAAAADGKPAIDLTERQACDLELLVNGGFSPLRGFMTQDQYEHVLGHMRLPEQQLFGVPVCLDVPEGVYSEGDTVILRQDGEAMAVMQVASAWTPNKTEEAAAVFGTTSLEHPGVHELATEVGKAYIGGPIVGLKRPAHGGEEKFMTPREVREENGIAESGSTARPLVAFQCRNPLHRAHWNLATSVLNDLPAARVLIHPTCGPTQPGDIDADTRIKTYKALEQSNTDERVGFAYLPYSMKMAGPREALQHMILRKNFGATHFIIGRDMAGTKSTVTGEDFYGPYDAQELATQHAEELGMTVLTNEAVVFTEEGFLPENEARRRNLEIRKLSGTEFRRRLRAGEEIPDWFAFPSVVKVLREEAKKQQAQDK